MRIRNTEIKQKHFFPSVSILSPPLTRTCTEHGEVISTSSDLFNDRTGQGPFPKTVKKKVQNDIVINDVLEYGISKAQ